MGGSGKWFKSLVTLKPLQDITNQEKMGDNNKSKKKWKLWRSSSEGLGSSSSKGLEMRHEKMGDNNKSKKKWKLWRSSSEGLGSSSSKGLEMRHVAASEASYSSFMTDDLLAAAMATIVRAQPKDFRAVKREWAAIRIQTAFRGLLARRALRALKAVVRIQAIFRGRQVRNQAAVTLKCMQALVRVQARVRSQCLISSEEQTVPQTLNDPTKEAEKGWCDNPGTLEDVRAKQQMRQQGVMKRERAMAYAVSRSYGYGSPNSRANMQPNSSNHHQRLDSNLLDSWMATKPWEAEHNSVASFQSSSTDQDYSLKVKTKNATTRILARPSLSAPSSESICDETFTSTSSASMSINTIAAAAGKSEFNHNQKPSYMNPTESIKAKQNTFRFSSSNNMRRRVADDDDTRSSADSSPSVHFSGELCRTRQDFLRNNQWRQGRQTMKFFYV